MSSLTSDLKSVTSVTYIFPKWKWLYPQEKKEEENHEPFEMLLAANRDWKCAKILDHDWVRSRVNARSSLVKKYQKVLKMAVCTGVFFKKWTLLWTLAQTRDLIESTSRPIHNPQFCGASQCHLSSGMAVCCEADASLSGDHTSAPDFTASYTVDSPDMSHWAAAAMRMKVTQHDNMPTVR